MSMEFVVIRPKVWLNERGCGIYYLIDHQRHVSLKEAIARGFELEESDDFNIGRLEGGRLTALLWMHEVIDEDLEVLRGIARGAGLKEPPTRTGDPMTADRARYLAAKLADYADEVDRQNGTHR